MAALPGAVALLRSFRLYPRSGHSRLVSASTVSGLPSPRPRLGRPGLPRPLLLGADRFAQTARGQPLGFFLFFLQVWQCSTGHASHSSLACPCTARDGLPECASGNNDYPLARTGKTARDEIRQSWLPVPSHGGFIPFSPSPGAADVAGKCAALDCRSQRTLSPLTLARNRLAQRASPCPKRALRSHMPIRHSQSGLRFVRFV